MAITSMGKEEYMALANAVCGNHLRSIVIVFDEIRKGTQPTVRSLLSELSEQLGNKITIREFDERRHPRMQLNHILGMRWLSHLFDGGAGKQLEEIGKCYDLFRAATSLPVIPARARTICGTSSRPSEWCSRQLVLVFNNNSITEESYEDLLKLQNVAGTKQVEVVPTGIIPEWGSYYHPGMANHPWLDRLVVVAHKDDVSNCMIIYQDKVNHGDFASACKNLDKAADLFSSATGLNDDLLVVNVMGASELTRAQAKMKWPYILIREMEISHFILATLPAWLDLLEKDTFCLRKHLQPGGGRGCPDVTTGDFLLLLHNFC
eukprot:scaffold119495_cov48-Attheya_sp.AAC.2